jgi:hypothetical protein
MERWLPALLLFAGREVEFADRLPIISRMHQTYSPGLDAALATP